jgi:outer membrane protein
MDVKNITEVAKNQLPNLKITENELLAAKKYLAQVKGSFAPSISLSAGWNTGYYKNSEEVPVQFKTQFKNNAGEYIGASLSIPIFAKFSRINSVKQANINYKKMEIAHEENIAFLENEVNAAYINWTVSKNEFVSAQKQLDKSIIAYKSAEKKLALGQINVIDFYIQKNEMFRAKTELLRTRVQLALQDKYLIFLFTGNWD